MTEPNLSKMKVADLKTLAGESGIDLPPKAKKQEIVDIIQAKIDEIKTQLAQEGIEIESKPKRSKKRSATPKTDKEEAPVEAKEKAAAPAKAAPTASPSNDKEKASETGSSGEESNNEKKESKDNRKYDRRNNGKSGKNNKRSNNYKGKNRNKDNAAAVNDMLNNDDCGEADGILDVQNDGYGFLRSLKKGEKDVYVSINQIRRFKLRQGDHIKGLTRPEKDNERYLALLYITNINGLAPGEAQQRKHFDDLTPVFPDEKLKMECDNKSGHLALRLIDLVAPVGKGQRGMIVSPPKAGKTTLLKNVANSISKNYPDMHLIILLIDERPEEVTDMQRSTKGEVVYSTFDERPENHCRVAEMVLERAKRLVEQDLDVVILLDSITRLARAYNLTVPPSGRTLSGGLDPSALFKPKRFFGAARNIEHGGSLTILATALVDTGSRMDDIVYEEFKGTGNMELHLDRKLQERRVFPAIDLYRSGTRREEVLMTKSEIDAIWQVRKLLAGNQETATEQLIDMMAKTNTNEDFTVRLNQWMSLMEKEGYRQPGR